MTRVQRSRSRHVLSRVGDWWDSDDMRLRIIRLLAWGLFAASLASTVYSGIQGNLPSWVLTLYATLVVQLVFLTFMYAIKHSGDQDIRRSIFEVRSRHVNQWRDERALTSELLRYAHCMATGTDPLQPTDPAAPQRLRNRKVVWPTVSVTSIVCSDVREALEVSAVAAGVDEVPNPTASNRLVTDASERRLAIDFLAYSAETLINLSREICAEVEEVLGIGGRFNGPVVVRILVRNTVAQNTWLIPLARDAERDEEYGEELRTRFNNVRASALREFSESLRELFRERNQVDFRVRGYLTEPFLKGVLINGNRGVTGMYTIDPLKNPSGYDYSGHAVPWVRADIQGPFAQQLVAQHFNFLFQKLWDSDEASTPMS